MSTFIIAEAGVNHNGSIELARQMVESAANFGADAIKFQSFISRELVTKSAVLAEYQLRNESSTGNQLGMLKKLELSLKEFIELDDLCKLHNIEFMTTFFDQRIFSELLPKLNLSALKIGSGELTNLPFLINHARTGKKIILSVGMARLGEIEAALAAIAFGYLTTTGSPISYEWLMDNYYVDEVIGQIVDKVSILHCTTEYPAPFDELNLNAIKVLQSAFPFAVGYSDHSRGNEACCAAVALGAVVIEKHFTLDKSLNGPDHYASASPKEFGCLVNSVRNLELALVRKVKAPLGQEVNNKISARKCLVANAAINEGEAFSDANLGIKRSSVGVSPKYYWDFIGLRSPRAYSPGDVIDWSAKGLSLS